MDIRDKVKSILQCEDILKLLPDKRVYYLHAKDPKPPYIEFEMIDEVGDFYAEDEEVAIEYTVQVDIFSLDDFRELEKLIKIKMKENGFNRGMSSDLYEDKTKLNHKAMRFNITVDEEE